MSKRLSRTDWDQLDTLLGKHGFGGYYDLVECLKMVLTDLGFGNTGVELNGEDALKVDLPGVIGLLRQWATVIGNSEGFQQIAEKSGTIVHKKIMSDPEFKKNQKLLDYLMGRT